MFGLMLVLLALDQGAKIWIREAVPLHSLSVLVPNFFDLTHVENKGVSFSLLGNISDSVRVPLLVGISALALGMLSYYWLRNRAGMNRYSDVAFALILPGAGGNLVDRLIFGTVTDYIHFRFFEVSFFVNNIADILISAGVALYIIGTLLQIRRDKTRE